MRLPRMTKRRWMIAVVVIGLPCLLVHRSRSFESRAAFHESRMVAAMFPRSPIKGLPQGRGTRGRDVTIERLIRSLDEGQRFIYFDRDGQQMMVDEVKVAIWHEAMARKYRRAASFPWFHVMSDPPMP